jgi:WS/DGAT/MGAT family acyltransferase
VANPDRLSALDSAFLDLEGHSTAHMHVALVMVFVGQAPTQQELVDHVLRRLHLVPRYRQRLAYVPHGLARPVWTDDPRFNPYYHVRHTALPRPADETALKQLAGRLFSQRLDRSKPLWEIWLVDRLAGGRFALIAKTHHALVDGISGVDITTVLFDRDPEATDDQLGPSPDGWLGQAAGRVGSGRVSNEPWTARPLPGEAKLLGEALVERATRPVEMARGGRALVRDLNRAIEQAKDALASIASATLPGISATAPDSPFNVDIGPHRRYTFLDAKLDQFKAIKDVLGGTLNDVVLAAVSLALGRYLRKRGYDTDGLVLKAMVPVSVRADTQRGALGNKVAAMWAPLPVGVKDPVDCFQQVTRATEDLKRSGQAVGAQVLTNLAGFAPPTILNQAARLQPRQRFFNLVVTNVPGPQFPLYLLGRRLEVLYPVVPLAQRQALGIAVMSYDGHLGFGLLGDYDVLPELDAIAQDLRRAIASLARAASAATSDPRARASRTGHRARPRSAAGRRAETSAGEGKTVRAADARGASPNGKPVGKRASRT